MGPKINKRKLSPVNDLAGIKRPRPIKTTTEKEFYEAAKRAAERPPTKAEKEKIERVRQERIRKLEKRAIDEETAAADAPLSSPTQRSASPASPREDSYSSEDDLFVDTMTGTPTEGSSAPLQDDQSMAIELHSVSDDDNGTEDSQRGRSEDTTSQEFGTTSRAPQQPKQDDLKDFLSRKLDTLASKQDIQIVITDIEGVRHNVTEIQHRVSANTNDIARLKSAVDQMSKGDSHRQPSAATSVDSPRAGTRLGMGRQVSGFLAGSSCEAQEAIRRAKYEEALRTIRIWPILGDTPERMRSNLEDFLKNALLQTDAEVELLGIERVARIRNQPGQRVHNEIRVQMSRPWARDHIASKGRLLSEYVDQENRPTAGIRMDVPDFLAADFKTLDRYGLRMKNTHGKGTKRYIKYDEPNLGLILELRMPGDFTWLRITPSMAREFVDASDREDIDRNRRKLTARRTLQPPTTSANYTPLNTVRGFGTKQLSIGHDSSDSDNSMRQPFNINTTPVASPDYLREVQSWNAHHRRDAPPQDTARKQTWMPGRR